MYLAAGKVLDGKPQGKVEVDLRRHLSELSNHAYPVG
jgi:hypothetical protein